MSWIEIIHVRNSDSSLSVMVQDFLTSLRRTLEQEGMSAFKVYSNAVMPGDISIHLRWSGIPPARDGSTIGKRIAYQFQQHTTAVRHSVWTALEDLAL